MHTNPMWMLKIKVIFVRLQLETKFGFLTPTTLDANPLGLNQNTQEHKTLGSKYEDLPLMQDHVLIPTIIHKTVLAMLRFCLPCRDSVLSAPAAPKNVQLCRCSTHSALLIIFVRFCTLSPSLFPNLILFGLQNENNMRKSLGITFYTALKT